MGDQSTAMGDGTTASGDMSTAMGHLTTANGEYCTAMGYGINATESQSLSVSGNAYAKSFLKHADSRLAVAVRPANTSEMLTQLRNLEVVEHSRSANYCSHFNVSAEQCAAERTIGLIAQQVAAVVPEAVRSGGSMRLMAQTASKDTNGNRAGTHKELEHISAVQSIDLHVLLAKVVGAVQAQSNASERQLNRLSAQNDRLTAQNEKQSKQITALSTQNQLLAEQVAWLMNNTQALLDVQHRVR
jgi:hypothetical protein